MGSRESDCPDGWDKTGLIDLLENELSDDARKLWEQHISVCPDCAAELKLLQEMHSLIGRNPTILHPTIDELFEFEQSASRDEYIMSHLEHCPDCSSMSAIVREMLNTEFTSGKVGAMPKRLQDEFHSRFTNSRTNPEEAPSILGRIKSFFHMPYRWPVFALGTGAAMLLIGALLVNVFDRHLGQITELQALKQVEKPHEPLSYPPSGVAASRIETEKLNSETSTRAVPDSAGALNTAPEQKKLQSRDSQKDIVAKPKEDASGERSREAGSPPAARFPAEQYSELSRKKKLEHLGSTDELDSGQSEKMRYRHDLKDQMNMREPRVSAGRVGTGFRAAGKPEPSRAEVHGTILVSIISEFKELKYAGPTIINGYHIVPWSPSERDGTPDKAQEDATSQGDLTITLQVLPQGGKFAIQGHSRGRLPKKDDTFVIQEIDEQNLQSEVDDAVISIVKQLAGH